jgi:hypothetical protein
MFDEIGVLTLDAYRLIIVISCWCICHFFSMECPSLSHLINVSLKSILSEISIAILPVFVCHWLGKSSSLSPSATAHFCRWDWFPVSSRLLDLPFKSSLLNGVF